MGGVFMFVCVCVSCDAACKHTFTCMWYGEFATGTIIRAEKQNEHRNPFREWPRYGAADNCIICRFNWKYKTPCTHHYGRLWYTSWRLMRRGTSHVCRGICASFKYHSTFRNLIGLHLSGWSNRWLRLPFQAWRTAPPPTHPPPPLPLWSCSALNSARCS